MQRTFKELCLCEGDSGNVTVLVSPDNCREYWAGPGDVTSSIRLSLNLFQ